MSDDLLQRFIFEDTDIRGELARLRQSYLDTVSSHRYPAPVAQLLGEFLAAAALLSATLKFEGTLTLQARSRGQVPLIMAEITSERRLRGIARDADLADSDDFHTLLADGQLAITITPARGQRYQGIVPLDGDNLAQCLEGYFRQSEQLATRLWLHCDGERATGMLLQELPVSAGGDAETRADQWQHATTLADTLTATELADLPFEAILHRLYHRDPVRLFDPQPLQFQCSCSATRTLDALRTLGQEELLTIIAEQGAIDINCEFCHQHYHFTERDVRGLFDNTVH